MTVSEELCLLEQTKQELQSINKERLEIQNIRKANEAICENAGDLSWIQKESTENVEKVRNEISKRKTSAIERAYKSCGIIMITLMLLSAIGFAIILIMSYSTMCSLIGVRMGVEDGGPFYTVVAYIVHFIVMIVISAAAISYYVANAV